LQWQRAHVSLLADPPGSQVSGALWILGFHFIDGVSLPTTSRWTTWGGEIRPAVPVRTSSHEGVACENKSKALWTGLHRVKQGARQAISQSYILLQFHTNWVEGRQARMERLFIPSCEAYHQHFSGGEDQPLRWRGWSNQPSMSCHPILATGIDLANNIQTYSRTWAASFQILQKMNPSHLYPMHSHLLWLQRIVSR
jgi:hypothetical protein